MTFGAEADEAASHRILDRYVEAGRTFVDRTTVDNAGASEEIIGRGPARTGRRDEIVPATTVRFALGEGPNAEGLPRPHVLREGGSWMRAARPGRRTTSAGTWPPRPRTVEELGLTAWAGVTPPDAHRRGMPLRPLGSLATCRRGPR